MEQVKMLSELGLPKRILRALFRDLYGCGGPWHPSGHINYGRIDYSKWDVPITHVISLFRTGRIDKVYGFGPYYKGMLAKAIVEKCGCDVPEVLKYIPKEPDMGAIKSRLKETLSNIESTLNDNGGVVDMFDRVFECRSTIEFVLEELK